MNDVRKIRLIIIYFLLLFGMISLKLINIAKGQYSKKLYLPQISGKRGDIYDRNGNVLATSIPAVSAYIKPDEFIIECDDSLGKIAKIFPNMDVKSITRRMMDKKFIWLKRYLSPKHKRMLMASGIPGLYLIDTYRRVYPDKNLFSHLLGGVDLDTQGIAGIEKYFNENLQNGNCITLSVDLRIQHIIREELICGIKKFFAKGAVGIIMDGKTGQILAMMSLPDFDLNNINSDSKTFNQATFALFEPGSIAKIFNIALGLESNAVTLDTEFDISEPIKIGRFIIHDFKKRLGRYSVEDIFKYSSNIGSAKIAQEIGKERQQEFLRLLGFFKKMNLELLECQRPMMPRRWSDSTLLTVSYGHGIAVTPLHMLTAINGILNDGEMVYPTLLIKDHIEAKKVISSNTSKSVRKVMRKVVQETSGRLANIGGYFVLGKTGTSEKATHGHYSKKENVCFFVAKFFRYALLVMLDDPKGLSSTYGFRSANWNAALVAGNIIKRIGPILGIVPKRDL